LLTMETSVSSAWEATWWSCSATATQNKSHERRWKFKKTEFSLQFSSYFWHVWLFILGQIVSYSLVCGLLKVQLCAHVVKCLSCSQLVWNNFSITEQEISGYVTLNENSTQLFVFIFII
jgi:hypothetical protein